MNPRPIRPCRWYECLEGFFHVAGVEPDERILAHLGAADRFDSDLVDSAFAALLFLLGKSAG